MAILKHKNQNYTEGGNLPKWIDLNYFSPILDYLSKNNTLEYTPLGDYNPATKKYVDDKVTNLKGALLINVAELDSGSIIKSLLDEIKLAVESKLDIIIYLPNLKYMPIIKAEKISDNSFGLYLSEGNQVIKYLIDNTLVTKEVVELSGGGGLSEEYKITLDNLPPKLVSELNSLEQVNPTTEFNISVKYRNLNSSEELSQNITIPLASNTNAGLMSTSDKEKLDLLPYSNANSTVILTKDLYDALETKDSNTIYFIKQ